MADGIWGCAPHQVEIEWRREPGVWIPYLIVGEGPGCFADGKTWDARQPAPTVLAHGIWGSREYQVFLVRRWYEKANNMTTDPTKPPFRVPLMAEISAARGTNSYRGVSTFSGCGGSCLGFELAGFEVLWASEFIEAAREVYQLNHPGVPVDARDVRDVRPEEILEACGVDVGELDFMEGSPPCAGFSPAGKLSSTWGQERKYSETTQRVDDLFFEFARLLRGIRPKVFVAENVAGLARGVSKGYFLEILRELKGCGYRVSARVLDAQWLGVPQRRRRLIFVGVREDLGVEPEHPRPLSYRYSIREALPWLKRVTGRTAPQFRTTESEIEKPMNCIGAHGEMQRFEVEEDAWINGTAIGREWDKLEARNSEGHSKRYFMLWKPDPDQPSPTITQTASQRGAAGVTHPTERRKFTIAELRRLCAFPDDFQLTGTYTQQWERLGRAVPPLMMFYVARSVRSILDKCAGSPAPTA